MTYSGHTGARACRIASTGPRLGSPLVPNRNRGIAASAAGLLILALNVIDAADRGASAGNIVAIACGAFLLFWGFSLVARSGRPPVDQD
jgi:hypothetical protein